MTDNKLWQCSQMKILIVLKQNYMQVKGKLYLGIQGHASASVLNPIGNGKGSFNFIVFLVKNGPCCGIEFAQIVHLSLQSMYDEIFGNTWPTICMRSTI